MKWYLVRTPKIVQRFFLDCTWSIPVNKKVIYLTFDDGPTKDLTPYILAILSKHQVPATFFCVGENVEANPNLVKAILQNKHFIGNHTHTHLNGWETPFDIYLNNIDVFNKNTQIQTKLFRPPYGKITRKQAKQLKDKGYKIIMWTVLTGDFDAKLSKEACLKNATHNIQSGDIIVFHDNIKAKEKLEFVLEKTIVALKEKGFKFRLIQ